MSASTLNGDEPGLAQALRGIRRQHRWTLADVSARTGIPIPTLSKVENGKLSLSYDKLLSLSRGLEVDITRLFSPASSHEAVVAPSGRRTINRAGEGHHIRTETYNHTYLATEILNKTFDPIIADLRARTMEEFGEWVRHAGEEFAYVLDGVVDFRTEFYAPVRLERGDSIFFDSRMGHAYLAAAAGPCRILAICTSTRAEILGALGVREDQGASETTQPMVLRAG